PVVSHKSEEQVFSLSNEELVLNLTTWGGGINSVVLNKYKADQEVESGPVVLDFTNAPAFILSGLPGLGRESDFSISVDQNNDKATIQSETGSGLGLTRTVALLDDYKVKVVDVFRNSSGSDITLGRHRVAMGPMSKIRSKATVRKGMAYLDVNSLGASGDDKIIYWDRKVPKGVEKLSKRFYEGTGGGGCSMFGSGLVKPLPHQIPEVVWDAPTDWLALKNKFFLQSLMPAEEASGMVINAKRIVPETEDPAVRKTWMKQAMLDEVFGALSYDPVVVPAGQEFTREMDYYVGPMEYGNLKGIGNYHERILFKTWPGFAWFRGVCAGILIALNAIYGVIPNYGIAIILLTIIIKIIFWPIMQKSTESMKKMQDLKPDLEALKEKYKNNPQKMQQEQMLLYKKHGVNPLASCLPMMIQMPVFIAMFTVLRKAVELRHAGFLWVTDLSEPEMLMAGAIP
ncbi:hypothetical protein BVX97_06350, partial [bacterium E08(2017)]